MYGGERLIAFEARVHCADGGVARICVSAQVLVGLDGRRLGGIGEWSLAGEGELPHPGHAMPFVLHYDGNHVLTAVEPHQPFLGWEPDEVIGGYFSLAGWDQDMTARGMESLMAMGTDHELGHSLALCANGSSALVNIRLRLYVEDAFLRGYSGEVRLLG